MTKTIRATDEFQLEVATGETSYVRFTIIDFKQRTLLLLLPDQCTELIAALVEARDAITKKEESTNAE